MQKPEALGWNSKVKMGSFGEAELYAHTEGGRLLGKHLAYADAAKDYDSLAASHEKLVQAHETLRDAVLNQRGALAENGMDSDQINDVLGEIDDAFSAALAEAEKLTK
jgi:hypothetical protein